MCYTFTIQERIDHLQKLLDIEKMEREALWVVIHQREGHDINCAALRRLALIRHNRIQYYGRELHRLVRQSKEAF